MCNKINILALKNDFWLSYWDTIVVKVGSNILAWNNNWVNLDNMKNIIDWIDYLIGIWLNVILVSSWAVAVWKNVLKEKWKFIEKENYSLTEKASFASIWQIKLLNFYSNLVEDKKNIIEVSQELVNHKTFENLESKENFLAVLNQNISFWVLNIINENDTVSREELKFSDNDELAWLVAKATKAKVLVLLSNIDWIYKNYWKENQELIEEVRSIKEVRKYCEDSTSSYWTWWMTSKLNVMEKMINFWIIWILANWWKKNILQKIFTWEECRKTVFR